MMGTTETWTNTAGFTGASPISDIVELNNILRLPETHHPSQLLYVDKYHLGRWR